MKRKSVITSLLIVLMMILSLPFFSACGKKQPNPVSVYSVTVTNGTGGGEYKEGATVKIKANAPETGKEFTSWTLDGVTVSDNTKAELTFTMPANSVTATANFGDVLYEFALENCTADKESAKLGEEVTFTADVFEDKRFVSWNVKGVDEIGLDLTKNPLTITMPANDIVVAAQLEQLYKIIIHNNCVADKEWAAAGEQVTVTKPEASEGHIFSWWTYGINQDWSNKENTVTFTMPANDVEISASEVLLNYLFTMVGGTATGVKNGVPNTVTDGRSDGFDYGTTVTIKANAPETGKKFTSWTLDGVTVSDNTKAELTFTMPANVVKATANYDYIDYTVTVNGGTTDKATAHYGDSVTINGEIPKGMSFTGWTLDGVTAETGSFSITFKMPANNVIATANYVYNNYNVTVNGGIADKTKAHYGEEVTITAQVPVGKQFVMWSFNGLVPDGLDITNTKLTFTMPTNSVTATAKFEDIDYNVKVICSTIETKTAHYGDIVTITAENIDGKIFVCWAFTDLDTEGLDLTSEELSFTMPANNVTAKAIYEELITLTFEETTATSGKLEYNDNDSKSFSLPLGSGQDFCTYTIELSSSAFTFKVYDSNGLEIESYDNGDGFMCIDIDHEDNYIIRVVNTGSSTNCTLTVTQI